MSQDLYQQLRCKLDGIGAGFNKTESGIELKILKKLFTEEYAQVLLHMEKNLEPAAVIAERAGRELAEISEILDAMDRKGLVFSNKVDSGTTARFYALAPFVHGFFEIQAHNLDDVTTGIYRQTDCIINKCYSNGND